MDRRNVVQSAERSLRIIQMLNQENGISANQMAMMTQISRAATYRTLETLRHLRFVRKDHAGRYWLESQILSLASGYDEDRQLHRTLAEVLSDHNDDVIWPLTVSTLSGNAMIIRAATDLESSAPARRRLSAGWAIPGLLRSAAGNIYLAFCDPRTRDTLLDMIAKDDEHGLPDDIDRSAIERHLDEIRNRGYEIVTHALTWNWIDRTSSIGVPVFSGTYLFGALSMRYSRKSLSDLDVGRLYHARLKAIAERLGDAVGK